MPPYSSINRQIFIQNSDLACIATRETILSYGQVYSLITNHKPNSQIIMANQTLDSIIDILWHILHKRALILANPRQPGLYTVKNLEDNHIYIPTSGTQRQKIAILSYQALFFSAINLHPEFNLTQHAIYALNLPLYHISGLMILIRSLMHSCCIALNESSLFMKSTHISMCTNQLKKTLDKNHMPNLKALLLGGGPISLALCKAANKLGYPLFTTYGMTEMCSQVTTQKFCPKKPLTMGVPLNGRFIKIDENQNILVKGKTLFKGYLNESRPLDHEGYFKSFDKGKLDKNGLIIISRSDRCIISGGENIYLDELELHLLEINGVLEAKVSSRKDSLYESRPVATCKISKDLKVYEIIEILEKKIFKYKIPFQEDFVLKRVLKSSGTLQLF